MGLISGVKNPSVEIEARLETSVMQGSLGANPYVERLSAKTVATGLSFSSERFSEFLRLAKCPVL